MQVCVDRYADTAVTSLAYDAARSVARADVDHDDPGAVAREADRAERDLRDALGRHADRLRVLAWDLTAPDDVIALRIAVDGPGLLDLDSIGGAAIGGVDTTVRVRVERLR